VSCRGIAKLLAQLWKLKLFMIRSRPPYAGGKEFDSKIRDASAPGSCLLWQEEATAEWARGMKQLLIATALCAGASLSSACLGVEATALEPGEYEVTVQLELPHIEKAAATKLARICVTGANGSARGLAVLSDNNPLTQCPASSIREDHGTLSFEIVCPGGNAAIGSAKFRLHAQGFEGAIAMKMGGKNMTMTEHQSGRRVGKCNPAAFPPS
jgi:hypothetical protein